MKIRSITCFYTPSTPESSQQLDDLAQFSQQLETSLVAAGMDVQSRRLATTPFPTYTSALSDSETIRLIQSLERAAKQHGFAYLSCGPATPDAPESYARIPALLAATQDVFFTAVLSDIHQMYPFAAILAAEIIVKTSTITPDGFANLRFSALANVPAGAPFLPAAYHQPGTPPAFSLAIECADLVLSSFQGQTSLASARRLMLSRLESAADAIEAVIKTVPDQDKFQFLGFDFSPAPFPQNWCSLGGAVEAVGSDRIGPAGSVAAAAVIADTLDQGNWKRAGFNGLMLPVLEDSVLAARAAEGILTVKDLLLYSAVCGTGLDTVPLAGDVTKEEIAALLLDVSALSVRLRKPLTARLMPIPGKKAGEETNFEFDFFANSRVMPLVSQRVQAPLNGTEPVPLAPKYSYR